MARTPARRDTFCGPRTTLKRLEDALAAENDAWERALHHAQLAVRRATAEPAKRDRRARQLNSGRNGELGTWFKVFRPTRMLCQSLNTRANCSLCCWRSTRAGSQTAVSPVA